MLELLLVVLGYLLDEQKENEDLMDTLDRVLEGDSEE